MSHPLETVKIGIDDPNCRGVTSSNGLVRYDANDHVVEVPRMEADKLLKCGHGAVTSYRKSWSMGISIQELEERARKRREGAEN
ncbi:hypothetical protein [Alicyclobacillus fastidiosus]|uniref:Uncharacterized protein n=1 Tax=Alicyclobacillus fastidiosus TaxID=392011 RepID=A0ABV5ANI8_9BACL|nr:hypothetical protein [Alicyclobacillus fastidiosus]WEH08483.1 hypothetical protein PYS47_17575 [Alicyclobacillus fastidiosus]